MSTVVEVPRRRHRGRNALIVIVVIVLVLVAAFFVGDYFAKKYATNYVRDQIASSLGLPSTAPVTVDLGSGSILLQAATGRINDVNVTVDPIVLDGLAGSATLTAHGVPLNQTTPVTSLDVKVSVPTSTVSTAISRVPALKSLKPKVTISGKHVAVAGTIYVFGFPQSVGATLTPKVTKGVPGFTIDTASLDGATVTASLLDRYLPGLTTLLESGTSLCIADQLPKSFTLTNISLQGQSIVSTFTGNGVELNAAALSQKGTCSSN
jgi:LmeA-like phospholipid-binding